MTNEERQRTMDFILQQQARMTAHLEQLQEERIRNQPRLAELRQSFKDLVELARIAEERMDNGEFRVTALETRSTALETKSAALEASMAHLAEAQARAEEARAHADERVSALAVTQAHADERVSALIDIIIEGRNGPS
ncbi:MAG: hypothetical protein ABR594_16990 [Pyrinomonadaceae bacterium]